MNQNPQERGVPNMEQAPTFSDYVSSIKEALKRTEDLWEASLKGTAPFGSPSTEMLTKKKRELENKLEMVDGVFLSLGTKFIVHQARINGEKGVDEVEAINRLLDSKDKKGTEYAVIQANILSKPLEYIRAEFDEITENMQKEYTKKYGNKKFEDMYSEEAEARDESNGIKFRDSMSSELQSFTK